MSITPLIEDTPVGRATKEISDYLYLDVKNTNAVFETLNKLAKEEWRDGFDAGEFHASGGTIID